MLKTRDPTQGYIYIWHEYFYIFLSICSTGDVSCSVFKKMIATWNVIDKARKKFLRPRQEDFGAFVVCSVNVRYCTVCGN